MVKENFYKKVLKNGMTVILEQRKNSGVVSVAFVVRHGGIHESSEKKGFSHFIEHMLYKGTKTRTSKQISEEIERNGGILNGFTEEEMTAYWCKMPASKIKVALDVLGDMVKNPLFDEIELNKERQVIFEEMKMRKDRPDWYIRDKIQSMLYSGNLSQDIVGTEKSLSSIDRKEILKLFLDIYKTENMFLCIVGDVDFNVICDYCENNFKKSSGKIKEPSVGLKNQEKVEKRKGIDQANMIFAYHTFKSGDEGAYASQVLACLMVGGMSSRLFQEIREKRNLAYAVKGGYSGGKRFGYNYVYVGTNKENIEKVKNIILEEFDKLKTLKEEELNQIKEQLIGNAKISREDSQGQMLDLVYNEVWDSAEKSYEYEKCIKKVKLEDVKKLASSVKEGNYSFIALIPE
jgi:predicted Zn-dependent peptidase